MHGSAGYDRGIVACGAYADNFDRLAGLQRNGKRRFQNHKDGAGAVSYKQRWVAAVNEGVVVGHHGIEVNRISPSRVANIELVRGMRGGECRQRIRRTGGNLREDNVRRQKTAAARGSRVRARNHMREPAKNGM